MTSLSPPLTHIRFDEKGRPWLEGTNIKVMEVVLQHLSENAEARQIFENLDGNIPLPHIHAALMYYYDNKTAFDEQIGRDNEEILRMRAEAGETAFERRMRTTGLRP